MPTKIEARVDKHDREIAAIRKLMMTGMKMLVRMEASQLRLEAAQGETNRLVRGLYASQKETDRMLKELKTSQTETDRMLKDLIRSLGRRGNGNGHRKTDLR